MTGVLTLVCWIRAHVPAFAVTRDERGGNLIEYTLLIALIVLMCLAAVTQFGTKVPAASFKSVANSI